MRHYQACFSSFDRWGLQVFNDSPGLPPEACASFMRFQSNNLKRPNFPCEEALHQPVAELTIDDSFVYHSRIRYDVLDDAGRRCLFTHGFIFHLEDFFRDPERVLLIDEASFKFTEKEARPSENLLQYMDPNSASWTNATGSLTPKLEASPNLLKGTRRQLLNGLAPVFYNAESIGEVKLFLTLTLTGQSAHSLFRNCSFTTGASPGAKPKGIYFSIQPSSVATKEEGEEAK